MINSSTYKSTTISLLSLFWFSSVSRVVADQTVNTANNGQKRPEGALNYALSSTIFTPDQENGNVLSNFFSATPLCQDENYLKCANAAKSGFQLCSVQNDGCQCYLAGASLVECSKHCSSYNLKSFYTFKSLCGTNPYILKYDDALYTSYNSKSQNSHHMIKDLHRYRDITSTRYTTTIVKNSANSTGDIEISAVTNDAYLYAIFDFSPIDDTFKEFERESIQNGTKALAKKNESIIFSERVNHEMNQLQQLSGNEKILNKTLPSKPISNNGTNSSALQKVSKDVNKNKFPIKQNITIKESKASKYTALSSMFTVLFFLFSFL